MIALSLLPLLAASTALAQSREDDFRPLPRYLDAEVALRVFQAATPGAQPCLTDPALPASGAATFTVDIGPDGRAVEVRGPLPSTGIAPVDACLTAFLRGLSFPSHDEPIETFGTTVAWTDRLPVPFPTVTWTRRSPLPAFLYVPSTWPADLRGRVLEHVGLDRPTPAAP